MKKKILKPVFLLLAAAFAIPAHAKTLTVIGITDFHGALTPSTLFTKDGKGVETGGAALLASHVRILREEAEKLGPSILIDAGDLFQGSMESNLSEGAPVIEFYNQLGVAAAAVGNHEFDFGPVGEKSVPTDASDDGQGAFKARIKEAKFPFLAANMTDDNGKTPSWIKRSVIFNADGVRIGVIGAATPSTPRTTNRANLSGLHFADPAEAVAREAKYLRNERKVDAVILTFHGGAGCAKNGLKDQDDLSSCKDAEVFDLVNALIKKGGDGLVDVVVAGHTHKGVAKRIGRTVILQAYSHGNQLSWAQVSLDKKSELPTVAGFAPVCGGMVQGQYGPTCLKFVVEAATGPVKRATFLGHAVEPDADTLALLEPTFASVRKIKERKLGPKALTELERSYRAESAIGNLVADATREAIPGINIGLTNGGGLRANIPAGPVNYGHVFGVLPFDNRLAVMTVKGSQLRKMVEAGHGATGGNLSWSGLTFAAEDCLVTDIEVAGKALDPRAIYTVATTDYLATGGTFDKVGIDESKIQIYWNGPYIVRDVLAEALSRWHTSGWQKDLRDTDFFDPKKPRQRISGLCGASRQGGGQEQQNQ